jgi:hypothetical protein
MAATARRARSALGWCLGAFVLTQAVLGVAVALSRPEFRDPPYWTKHRRLRQRLAGTPRPARTVVMLGSSRTAFALDGATVESALDRPTVVFNLGVYGAGPLTQRAYLRRMLADGVRPDLLLVEVLPVLLQDGPEPAEASTLPAQRLSLADVPLVQQNAGPGGAGLEAAWWRGVPLPVWAHRQAILSGLVPSLLAAPSRLEWWGKMDACGWARSPEPPDTLEARRHSLEMAWYLWGARLAGLRHGGPACAALEDLLAEARHQGLALALVLMPEGPVLRSWYDQAGWRNLRAYLDRLSRRFGCPLVNARAWMAEEDFVDSQHLRPAGARRFSERLGREVVQPLLDPQTSHRANASVSDLTGSRRGMNSCPRKPL